MRVYLAGPISGCTYDQCTDWRARFAAELKSWGVEALSPMRGKDYLNDGKIIDGAYDQTILSNAQAILHRDFWDCCRSDVVLVNLLGAERVSIGTVMEIAFAHARQIPVVLLMEPKGNIHEHPMIQQAIAFRVETVDQALQTLYVILNAQ